MSGKILEFRTRETMENAPPLQAQSHVQRERRVGEPLWEVLAKRRVGDKIVTIALVDGVEEQFERDATESDVLSDTL